jgi:hypothetical protein
MAAREGLQAAEAQYALLKKTPRRARSQMWGVLKGRFSPKRVIPSFMSSIAMKRTFGLRTSSA